MQKFTLTYMQIVIIGALYIYFRNHEEILDLIKNLPNVSSIKLNIVCCDQKCMQPVNRKTTKEKREKKI